MGIQGEVCLNRMQYSEIQQPHPNFYLASRICSALNLATKTIDKQGVTATLDTQCHRVACIYAALDTNYNQTTKTGIY